MRLEGFQFGWQDLNTKTNRNLPQGGNQFENRVFIISLIFLYFYSYYYTPRHLERVSSPWEKLLITS